MDLFRRKQDRRASDPGAAGKDIHPRGRKPVTHRLTKELVRAESLALMLATSRAAAVVDVPDYLAGIYIYDWERLSDFWEDQEGICAYLQTICRISPERWHHWIEFYDRERRENDAGGAEGILGSRKGEQAGRAPLGHSRELESVLRRAEVIAPPRDILHGQSLPIRDWPQGPRNRPRCGAP